MTKSMKALEAGPVYLGRRVPHGIGGGATGPDP